MMPPQEKAVSSEPATSSGSVWDVLLRVGEKYGFGCLLSLAILWFVRTDLVLPIVASHQAFLQEMVATQRELARTLQEQTRLLYQLQPRSKDGSAAEP